MENGKVVISDDVIKKIVEKSIENIDGVIGLYEEEKKGFFNNKQSNGFKVDMTESECVIDIKLVFVYGLNVHSVSEEIQKKIKIDVEKMTSLVVREVNINVSDLEIIEERGE